MREGQGIPLHPHHPAFGPGQRLPPLHHEALNSCASRQVLHPRPPPMSTSQAPRLALPALLVVLSLAGCSTEEPAAAPDPLREATEVCARDLQARLPDSVSADEIRANPDITPKQVSGGFEVTGSVELQGNTHQFICKVGLGSGERGFEVTEQTFTPPLPGAGASPPASPSASS